VGGPAHQISYSDQKAITKERLLEVYAEHSDDLNNIRFSDRAAYSKRLHSVFQTIDAHKYRNRHSVPKIVKIVVSRRFASSAKGSTKQDQLLEELALMTGRRPLVTKAQKSVAAFNIRKGMDVGASVTLRGGHMASFLEKLIKINLPRFDNFKGIARKALRADTLSIGLSDLTTFPEMPFDLQKGSGININIVGSTKDEAELFSLFTLLGLPILDEPYREK
jgi:large subunit ribosomal protein L5